MKWQAYPEYRASGVEWLGEVPAHWDTKRLKWVLSEPLMYGANESAGDDNPDNPRYLRITDIADNGTLRDDTFRSLPHDVAAAYMLADGDVLLARSGATVGKSFIYEARWGACCFAGYLLRARLDRRRMRAPFFYSCCQTAFYWHFINSCQIQATIQNVSAERYASLFLPCPPIDEQKAILVFLDRETARIDSLIAKKQALIDRLNEKRSALISRTVTRGLPPEAAAAAGLDPHPPLTPTGIDWIGDIPGHWTMPPLYIRYELGLGKMLDEKRITGELLIPYLRNVDVQWDFVNTEDLPEMDISPAVPGELQDLSKSMIYIFLLGWRSSADCALLQCAL